MEIKGANINLFVQLVYFKKYFMYDSVQSILTIGAILGTFIGADLSDRWGRQQTLIATAVVAIIGWIMVSLSNSFAMIAVARFILGMSIGMVNTASPVSYSTCPLYEGWLILFRFLYFGSYISVPNSP